VDRHGRRRPNSSKAIGGEVTVVNDADAAGVAEMTFRARAKGRRGLVIMITPRYRDRQRAVHGRRARAQHRGSATSRWASTTPSTSRADSVRETNELSWKDWSKRVAEYLLMVEALFQPPDPVSSSAAA